MKPQPFTYAEYRELLELALKHYSFVLYENYTSVKHGLFLRHDIDFSVHSALKLAQIESDLEIRSTYFVHLHSKFYNSFEDVILKKLKEIISLGHAVGLHFNAGFDPSQDWQELLKSEKQILEILLNNPVKAFSFHNPGSAQLEFAKDFAGMTNTYNAHFKTQVSYVSDSNGAWKFRTLREILEDEQRPERLQVLTHPGWWTEEYMAKPQDKLVRIIRGRAEDTEAHFMKNSYYIK